MEAQFRLQEARTKGLRLSLILQIVQDIELGRLSTTQATKLYGIECRKTVINWVEKYGKVIYVILRFQY